MLIQHIEDLENPLLDPYRELKRSNLTRWSKWFIAEGRRVVERLLDSNLQIFSVLLSEKRLEEVAPLILRDVPVLVVPHELCSQLVGFDFHTGVMACGLRPQKQRLGEWVAEMADQQLAEFQTLVACPNTTLPDNLGSIFRLAAAFSVDGVIVGSQSADPYSRRSVRVSMGNLFQMHVFEPFQIIDELNLLKSRLGFRVIACHKSERSVAAHKYTWPQKSVLVLGNEAFGIPAEVLAICDAHIEIPIAAKIDSLNVSTAAALLMYERSKQVSANQN